MESGHAENAEFDEVTPRQSTGEHLDLADLNRVRLRVDANLGTAKISVQDIIALKEGSIIALDTVAGEMTTITVNDLPLARGEVVVLGDALHVRIAEITGLSTNGLSNVEQA